MILGKMKQKLILGFLICSFLIAIACTTTKTETVDITGMNVYESPEKELTPKEKERN